MSRIKFSTSLLAKNSLILALVCIISSCGFKPLYAKKEGERSNFCTNFIVNKVRAFQVTGEKMQYELQDALNQACINQDKNYKVSIDITKTKTAISIQKDTSITRYNLNLTGTYKVFEDGASKPLVTGTSIMVGGFDAVTSDFGTYALEEDAQANLMKEMANDMSLKISAKLLRKTESK